MKRKLTLSKTVLSLLRKESITQIKGMGPMSYKNSACPGCDGHTASCNNCGPKEDKPIKV